MHQPYIVEPRERFIDYYFYTFVFSFGLFSDSVTRYSVLLCRRVATVPPDYSRSSNRFNLDGEITKKKGSPEKYWHE